MLQGKEEQRETEAIEMKLRRAGSMKLDRDSCCECTMDGSVDFRRRPASKKRTGGWLTGLLLLGKFS